MSVRFEICIVIQFAGEISPHIKGWLSKLPSSQWFNVRLVAGRYPKPLTLTMGTEFSSPIQKYFLNISYKTIVANNKGYFPSASPGGDRR
jgi:hypothetical protein